MARVKRRGRLAALILAFSAALACAAFVSLAQGDAGRNVVPPEALSRVDARAAASKSSDSYERSLKGSELERRATRNPRRDTSVRQPAVLAFLGASFAILGVLTRVRYRPRHRR